jgi:hypothetical protein
MQVWIQASVLQGVMQSAKSMQSWLFTQAS